MATRNGTCSTALVSLATLALTLSAARAADAPRFNRDIRPILADNCFRCHGPAVKKGGLRLDMPEVATKPASSGETAIVPGHADESEAIRRVFSDDADEVMPPPSGKKPLSDEEKALLRAWVDSGAKYERHWSFEPPVKAPLPGSSGPDKPAGNPIDAFLRDRLAREGLAMSPEADKNTLIRRVAFALTGLPPTLREVDDFLGDSSSSAYANMVERYLHSPRFGEEMARHWLDVARYADTHGLHLDNERQMWPYRDWVVRAFNDGKPFDQFVVEQLAGDLVPGSTVDQKIATGFNRCNVTTGEGGSIEAEWFFRNAVDRATTAAEAFMGLTVGCCVCHDHKFDPLPSKEFYAFYSFFFSGAGTPLDGNVLRHEPVVRISSPELDKELASLAEQIAEAGREKTRLYQSLAYADPSEEASDAAGEKAPKGPADDAAKDPKRSFKAWVDTPKARNEAELPQDIKRFLNQIKQDKDTTEARSKLREYYVANVCESTRSRFAEINGKLDALTKKRASVDGSIPTSFMFADMEKPRDSFVMMRGQYDKPGEKTEPGTFSALPPLRKASAAGRATRLDLANWLVSAEHPLTARVTVNRFWQQMFGTGLVKTSYDFGTQGELPSHPELLDWLSVRFRESGWDTRALLRLMLTSDAFRQSSRATPELIRKDPENRLLARGPRFRLEAEQVRDNALFVSGLMDLKMGGRGVNPYQPPRIWEPVAFTGSNTMNYAQDHGSALYRRSLYTFLKRTAPPPFMANFDAPNREAFCTRRERSNTPLQALQLMNDVQHFEAARALAERLMTEAGPNPADRIRLGFRLVLARQPDDEELAIVNEEWKAHLARMSADPASARAAIRAGESKPRPGLPENELAAYTLVANMLLNLDETLTRN